MTSLSRVVYTGTHCWLGVTEPETIDSKKVWLNACSSSVTKTLETRFIEVLLLVVLFLVLIWCLVIVPLSRDCQLVNRPMSQELPIIAIRKIDIGEFAGTNIG